jgi:hypothetical protein
MAVQEEVTPKVKKLEEVIEEAKNLARNKEERMYPMEYGTSVKEFASYALEEYSSQTEGTGIDVNVTEEPVELNGYGNFELYVEMPDYNGRIETRTLDVYGKHYSIVNTEEGPDGKRNIMNVTIIPLENEVIAYVLDEDKGWEKVEIEEGITANLWFEDYCIDKVVIKKDDEKLKNDAFKRLREAAEKAADDQLKDYSDEERERIISRLISEVDRQLSKIPETNDYYFTLGALVSGNFELHNKSAVEINTKYEHVITPGAKPTSRRAEVEQHLGHPEEYDTTIYETYDLTIDRPVLLVRESYSEEDSPLPEIVNKLHIYYEPDYLSL